MNHAHCFGPSIQTAAETTDGEAGGVDDEDEEEVLSSLSFLVACSLCHVSPNALAKWSSTGKQN